MFNSKQEKLFTVPEKDGKIAFTKNAFVQSAIKQSAETISGNGALKYSSTNNYFIDQFGQIGSYKTPRTYKDISNDVATIWTRNPYTTLCLIFFIRMITRITSLFDGSKTSSVQKGSGLKHEGIVRMMWVSINYPDVFWKNISLFISIGSWKDIIMMLSYDLQYNGWKNRVLSWDNFGKLLLAGLENPNTSELIKKYLPQIKANSKCKTLESQADNIIAKWVCSLLFGNKSGDTAYYNYKKYRKLKSSGTAHQWQKLISQGKHNLIDFNTIHGRALAQLVSGKYLNNNGLEQKYQEWIEKKPIAKYTGYVHELAHSIRSATKKYQIDTINAQYKQLLELAGKTNSNFIVVKDTSTSMNSPAFGTNMSSYEIAKAISIYLANLLKGRFHNHYIDFSSKAILREVKGSTFVEHWNTETRVASADTNFLAVADIFISVKNQNIEESEFPSGIICISDGEFNRVGMFKITNIEAFRLKLENAGFSRNFINNFKFCFWDIRNTFYGHISSVKFETFNNHNNVYYFSGYDPSVITFLTGVENKEKPIPKNAEELFSSAMDQEIMHLIEI